MLIAQEYEKASKGLNMLLTFVTYKVDRSNSTSLRESLIRPLNLWIMAMSFRTTSFYDCDSTLRDSLQYKAARLVTRASKGTSSARLYKAFAWESFSCRRKLHISRHSAIPWFSGKERK